MRSIFWTGYCGQKRMIAIKEIEKIVSDSDGFIIDFKQFSDVSLSLNIEIEELYIDELFLALRSYMTLDDAEELNSSSNRECTVWLNVTFTQGTGDLMIEIPTVPG